MDKQRKLKKIIAYLIYLEKVENQKDFAKSIDINVSNLSSAINGNKLYLKDALFEKILQKFPEVEFILKSSETLNHSHNEATHNINSNGNNNTPPQQDSQVPTQENNIYSEMIATQRELIDTLKEQNSQYRKEIENLRQKIKGYVEKSKK